MSAVLSVVPASSPTLAQLVDDYFAHYAGRDATRPARIAWWVERMGSRTVTTITDDDIFIALEDLAIQPARRYAGKDADGRKVYRALRYKRAPATINRYHVALAALFSWAIKKRRVTKGWENPCRKIERQPESAGIVRFLRTDECERLLTACKASNWKRLYLLVLLAITTGARRSELTRLRWCDIDFARGNADVSTTKNGEPKVLPLVPAAIEELKRLEGAPAALVFCSRVKPDVPYHFDTVWQAALKAAKVHRFRFHDLRHTCASYLAQSGASLLEIADVLGHRQLAMTKRYAHLTVGSKASLVNRILGDIR